MQLIDDLQNNKNCIYSYSDIESLDDCEFELYINVIKLANDLNIRLLNEKSRNFVMWDGFYLRHAELSVDNILHDFAHYQIALPYHRNWFDFGLGAGPESNYRTCKHKEEILNKDSRNKTSELFKNEQWIHLINSRGMKQLQETFSSVLGILWCKKFQIETSHIFIDHTWMEAPEMFEEVALSLQENQFIDDNFNPTIKLNN